MDILEQAQNMLSLRGQRYGSVEETFDRAAKLASIILDKQISIYDIAIIMHSMKMARINASRTYDDNYVDGINYLAFAAQFSRSEEQIGVALQEDIAAMARKFAPRKKAEDEPKSIGE